jgi:hypothetical protein
MSIYLNIFETKLKSGEISGEDFMGTDVIRVTGQPEQVPEFPIVALPILSVIGLLFLFQRRKGI